MNKTLLITRPNHDLVTNYLFFWSQPVIALAKEKRFTLHDLSSKTATRAELEHRLASKEQSLIFLNGHGNSTVVAGHDDQPIIVWQENEGMLKGTIIYARSCDVGNTLGKSLVENGALAFIGYNRKFVFMYLSSYTTKPLKDPTATLFLKPSNRVMQSLIKGHTAKEAFLKSQREMRKNLRMLLSSKSVKENQSIAFSLWSNIRGQILLGNPNASLINN